jgi:hypothetical protein
MPLVGNDLATAIKTAMDTAMTGAFPQSAAALQSYNHLLADAIANAVVVYLVANTVVHPTALVWPGGTLPAPVTGTGTIT